MSVRPLMRATAVLVLLVAFAVAATSATAARDRTPPTKPGDLRVTAKTLTSVSLAWNASTDNSGSFSYVVRLWQDPKTVTLSKSQTSYTWTGLRPGVQYYFWVEAVDGSGNTSTSDLVVVTTVADKTPPSPPADLTVGSVTASQVSLAWNPSTDDGGVAEYLVSVSPTAGAVVWTGATSVNVVGLAPLTTYTFTVRARDFGWNFSQPSAPVSATTAASADTQPPTEPANLYVADQGCGEVHLTWTQSTDDQAPQSAIRYRILINGTPDPFGDPIGTGFTITYGVDGPNTFVLHAIDSAGNVSAPSNTFSLVLDDCM